VLSSLPVKGFLGTGATFEADLNLVVQLWERHCSQVLVWQAKTIQGSRRLPTAVLLLSRDDRTVMAPVPPTRDQHPRLLHVVCRAPGARDSGNDG
jgi:hypothetical protein